MNDFMTGALHPLLTPAHVLILLALGLCLGQHPPLRLRMPLSVFASCSAIGLALTATRWFPGVHPAALAGIALGAGALAACEKELPSSARGALFGVGALAIGSDSGVETGGAAVIVKTLLGTWLGLLIYLMNLAYYASLAAEQKKKWLRIGLRVAGSWIVAISLLVLAFALHKV